MVRALLMGAAMPRTIALLVILTLSFFVRNASAFTIETGYPTRTNTDRSAPPAGAFDIAAKNAGINRADCLDGAQRFHFELRDVPSEATQIEVWARADAGSCAPPDERKSHCFRVATWKAGEARELDTLSIVQAMEQQKSVDTKGDAAAICQKASHMMPKAVHLHVLALEGSDVVGYSAADDSKPAEIDYVTLYDIGGPAPPVGFTLSSGESLLTVKIPATKEPAGDFEKYRVYCFRGAGPVDAGTDTSADTHADAHTDAATDAHRDASGNVHALFPRDGGTDAATDSAEQESNASCPVGDPFDPATFPTSALDPYFCGESTSQSGEIVLDGRENDLPYAIAVAAVDKQGNTGILSPVACETPRATTSFWDNYEAAGGRAGGGYCSFGRGPAAASTIVVGVFVVLAFVTRKRRLAPFVIVPILAYASPSRADEEARSWVMLEARLGAYRPRVDDAFAHASPYEKTFGSTPRLMVGAEADVLPLHIPMVGSLGFGALAGFTRATAHQTFTVGGAPSDSKTSFETWLFALVATFRLDVLARETIVPITPYAKLGVATGLWSSSDGDRVSHTGARDARGHTNGFFYAAGAMLLLDAFDRQAAKSFSVERGVKHSYVFLELTCADLRGVGQTEVMRVGAKTWTAGIAFEM